MARKRFWTSDALWAAGIALLVLAAGASPLLRGLERWAYDVGVRASTREPAPNISIVAIDEHSIRSLGRWPWRREVHAKMFDTLAGAGAKVVASTVLFSEPQEDAGTAPVRALAEAFESSGLAALAETGALAAVVEKLAANAAALPPGAASAGIRQAVAELRALLERTGLSGRLAEQAARFAALARAAAQGGSDDARLAESVARGRNVVLPMFFGLAPGVPLGNPEAPLPEFLKAHALPNVRDPAGLVAEGAGPLRADKITPPIAVLGAAAAGIGHVNVLPDVDGGVRTEPLVVQYYDAYFPSLALAVAARSLNLAPKEIEVRIGEGVRLKNLFVPTDSALQMYPFYYAGRGGAAEFPVHSFFDVLAGKVPAAAFKDRIVLIGPTAEGISPRQVTPLSPATDGVVRLAHTVSSILQQHFFVVPAWALALELGALALAVAYLVFVFPRLGAAAAAAASAGFAALLLALEWGLMVSQAVWVKLMLPVVLLAVGHVALTTKRFLLTEKRKAAAEAVSARTSLELGRAMHQAGQLDLAFEYFQKCPLDDELMAPLYQLALDFERKRQFNKAAAVYRYMAQHDPKYRDIEARQRRSEQLEGTVLLGAPGAHPGGTLVLDLAQKPTLGRYEIEKELGRGAMGMVYLGRDPKINRVVAIKTMALAQEFEADELAEAKARFFREAESAGRLNHPGIVAIYDAGEEHDLAYIAMEFLQGGDLVPYTQRERLLPIPKVLDIVARVADALDYAHRHNVVHRDIKPANVMYDPAADTVKVTDFGIARVADSSRTKTGTLLGTPSYMAPEQLASSKVDGRADLYALGVMLFQLLAGELPFKADSLAALMYKIANEPLPDVRRLRPEVPDCARAILLKATMKDPERRFQTGAEMRDALRRCAALAAGARSDAQ